MDLKDSSEISKDIISDILNKTPASIENVKSLTDLKLFQISWIFDFNYKISLDEVKKRKIIIKIFSTIPKSLEVEKCFEKTKQYLNSDWPNAQKKAVFVQSQFREIKVSDQF